MSDQDIFDELAKAWGNKPIVPRHMVGEASGFTVSPKSCANLDSLGQGPPGKLLVNGRACYPSADFFSWLRARSKRQ